MTTSSIKGQAFQLYHWPLLTAVIAHPFFDNVPVLYP